MTETLKGIAASDGVAVAPAYLLVEPDLSFEKKTVSDVDAEVARFEKAIADSKAKLEKKNLDLIVANNVKVKGAGFGTDTNVVTLISKDEIRELPKMTKEEVADKLLNYIKEKTER